jgi:hypothetical protein
MEAGDDERFDEIGECGASQVSIVEGPGPGVACISDGVSDAGVAPEARETSARFFFSSASFL